MNDPRESAYHGSINPTPERVAAWSEWKGEYVLRQAERWMADGQPRDLILTAAAGIFGDFAQLDEVAWMTLGDAFAEHLSSLLMPPTSGTLEGDARLNYMSAIRTLETASEYDKELATAYHFGVSMQAISKAKAGMGIDDDPDAGVTALYRHYDADGELLYIGITNDPAARKAQHAAQSAWFQFVGDTAVEWHPERSIAEQAEREAIGAERPIFNATHNKANRDAALRYMFAALERATKAGAA